MCSEKKLCHWEIVHKETGWVLYHSTAADVIGRLRNREHEEDKEGYRALFSTDCFTPTETPTSIFHFQILQQNHIKLSLSLNSIHPKHYRTYIWFLSSPCSNPQELFLLFGQHLDGIYQDYRWTAFPMHALVWSQNLVYGEAMLHFFLALSEADSGSYNEAM